VALRGVDVDLISGRLNVVLGPNGSGKSTLLGVVGGVMRVQSGTVRAVGWGCAGAAAKVSISWVSHDSQGYADLSVRENFELGQALNGWSTRCAEVRAFQEFGLERFAGRRLRECSRGQRQRAALARAVANRADVLLLDEPTSGLDLGGVGAVVGAVEAEVARGAVVVVVTHEVEAFVRLKGRRIVMAAGRVVAVEG
jgi:heme exporter protein A